MQNFTEENLKIENNLTLPILAIRGLVFFPGMMLQFDVARKKSILAASEAVEKDRLIFLVTQVNLSENEPSGDDLYKTGAIARIKQVVHRSEEGVKLHVEGLYRGEIQSLVKENPYLVGNIRKCPIITYKNLPDLKLLSASSMRSSISIWACLSVFRPMYCWGCFRKRTAAGWRTIWLLIFPSILRENNIF